MFETRKEYLDILRRLQSVIFPKLKKNWGNNVWGIMQIGLGFLFHHIYANKIDDSLQKDSKMMKVRRDDIKRILKLSVFLPLRIIRWSGFLRGKTLIISHSTHFITKDGKRYNIFSGSYKNRLEECDEAYFDFEIDTQERNGIKILFDDLNSYCSSLLKIKNKILSKEIRGVLYNVKLVDTFFDNDEWFNSNKIAFYLRDVIIENHILFLMYKTFLAILRPKQVWVYCYYSLTMLALVRAANALNIRTIEYQHSVISDNHFAYTKWERIDEYSATLPRYFWVWTKDDKIIIEKNFMGHMYKPVVQIVGNMYLEQEANSSPIDNKNDNRDVLIALQGQWIPDFVEKVIVESVGVMWYFRLHPRYPYDKERLLSFASRYPDKINIDEANNMLLYDLFRKISTVIVMFSTIAIEAHKFGLKVIIVGEEGYFSYEQSIKNAKYYYASDVEQLSKLL